MKASPHYGYIKDGRLQADTFREALRALDGKAVALTVEEYREKRSNQANRYYHGIVVDLIHRALIDGGWEITREGTHEMLKFRFLRVDKPIGNDGEYVTLVRSTTELDRQEFGDYIEACVRFAAEYLGVVIPPPMEQMQIDEAA